ncbi:aminotransferase class I/II-fold pyridoxal phosphate-dependent enzyme [bacterium 210820-DFI.6.37]|nr:aminotransferase class I/II-fold pyridoxal phosphate-dependent enzyme [bacterium 210820-DFI.6.37]
MNKWGFMEKALEDLKKSSLYRTVIPLEGPQSAYVTYEGRKLLMLASNAYLDLCDDPRIKEYTIEVIKRYGTGSGGSRLTTGTTELHVRLEKALARFKGREAALVFNTGFAANTGILPAVCQEGGVIFSDEMNHASIIDGCHLAKAKTVVYRHNDMADLERKTLREWRESGRKGEDFFGLVVSDGVFSMDGDIVNLPELIRVTEKYGLLSMIDEAHSVGVLGKHGRGVEEHFHMEGSVDILMGTLSKAFGSEGGYVCGSDTLISYLRNKARSFIFSTSLSPATIAAALRAVELLEAEPQRTARLQENVRWFCQCLKEQGMDVWSETAVIPIRIGDEGKAAQVSRRLLEQGYYISAIRYPTVKKGQAILRAALMSAHTKEDLRRAAKAIAEAVRME